MPRRDTELPKEWEQPFNAQIVSIHIGLSLKAFVRECSQVCELPKSVASLQSLRHVICDEDVSRSWKDTEKAKSGHFRRNERYHQVMALSGTNGAANLHVLLVD
ncbi:hypothetical protein Q3G72_006383 [Acer saccharum]|nr:hypothetical protein Q3G72_006383 [Acer saccharum]